MIHPPQEFPGPLTPPPPTPLEFPIPSWGGMDIFWNHSNNNSKMC